MQPDPVVALERLPDGLRECAVGEQARDLVLVLDGQQAKRIAGHRFGQARTAGAGPLLGLSHLLHQVGVAPCQRVVLVVDQVGAATLDQFVEPVRQPVRCRLDMSLLGQPRDAVRIAGDASAPLERRLVVGYRCTVEFDRARQRLARHRHTAALPCATEQQHVGVDRMADQSRGQPRGVQEFQCVLTHRQAQCLLRRSRDRSRRLPGG